MELENDHQLQVTKTKLRVLQERLAAARLEVSDNPRAHELSMRSLTRMINQMTEEITRFEAHRVATGA